MDYSFLITIKNRCNHAFLILAFLSLSVVFSGCDAPTGLAEKESQAVTTSKTAEELGYEITMTDLGTLGGEGDSYALDINDNGQIVGFSYHPPTGKEVPVTWKNRKIIDLYKDANFTPEGEASDINNNGAIVVQYEGDSRYLLEGEKSTRIYGVDYIKSINDKNQVSGTTDRRAVVWENGKVEKVTGSEIKAFDATHITNTGIISGVGKPCFCSKATFEAIIWEDGKMMRLGTLGEEGIHSSHANAVNNKRQVVGSSRVPEGTFHAFLWENGVMTDLGTLGDDEEDSVARSINNKGQIVGLNFGEQTRAVLWIDGKIIDLGSLVENGTSAAYSINNNGQIVGFSSTEGANDHAVLWEIKKIE